MLGCCIEEWRERVPLPWRLPNYKIYLQRPRPVQGTPSTPPPLNISLTHTLTLTVTFFSISIQDSGPLTNGRLYPFFGCIYICFLHQTAGYLQNLVDDCYSSLL